MLPEAVGALSEAFIVQRLQTQALPAVDGAMDGPALTGATHLRPAAVLIPMIWDGGQWNLLFTRRTEHLASHKGQVSFPGGASEPEDNTPETTALREAYEEIGLEPENVQVFGRLVSRPTVSHFIVTPVVGRIRWPKEFTPSPQEVSRIFTIPLAWLADPAHREERPRTLPNGYHEKVIYYEPYDGEILWGASARITVDLLRVLQ